MKKEIGKQLPAPNKLRPSDVIAIPIDEDLWAYARILKGAMMSILDVVSKERKSLNEITVANVAFYVEFYEPYDVSPWVYLGKWKFKNEDESLGPPTFIKDKIDPQKYRILHRGKITNCTESQVKSIQPHGLLDPKQINQKILSNIKALKIID
jgi:hypothetical protein